MTRWIDYAILLICMIFSIAAVTLVTDNKRNFYKEIKQTTEILEKNNELTDKKLQIISGMQDSIAKQQHDIESIRQDLEKLKIIKPKVISIPASKKKPLPKVEKKKSKDKLKVSPIPKEGSTTTCW